MENSKMDSELSCEEDDNISLIRKQDAEDKENSSELSHTPSCSSSSFLENSFKPLWIKNVKKIVEGILPNIDMKDLESTKDLITKDEGDLAYYDMEEYPYYTTIKKLLYAFGDTYNNNQKTVVFIHEFIKSFVIELAKLINECELKKIIEHFYSYEYDKFYNYKKLKFKNNFITNKEEKTPMRDLSLNEDLISYGGEFDLGLEDENTQTTKIKAEVKDENYFDNLAFQDERTSKMDNSEYLEYINCRQQTFLTKGKKVFSNFLHNSIQNNLPLELKDPNNLELISFILKELIRKIVTAAIKSKHPKKKLFILHSPITVDDLEAYCKEELDKIQNFLADFYTDIYVMKEFKKKKLDKDYNKNVKVKKKNNATLITIKKYVLLDEESAKALKIIKQISENKILSCAKFVTDRLKQIKAIILSKKSSKKISGSHLTLVDLIKSEYGLSNYYEYFLVKDLFSDQNLYSLSVKELWKIYSTFSKINKRYFSTCFDKWIYMSKAERESIIEEYERNS